MNIFACIRDESVGSLYHYIRTNPEVVNITSEDEPHVTPLMLAAVTGIPGKIKVLLHFNADINIKDIDGNTVLHHAMQSGESSKDNISVIQLLLDAGADINALNNRNYSCLDYTMMSLHWYSTLHWYSKKNWLIILKYLIKRGINPFLIQKSFETTFILSEQIKAKIKGTNTYFRVIPQDICTMLPYYTN